MSVDLFEALIAGTIGGGGGSDKYVAGANITITDNADGTKTIAASGEVSSEDTVARADIANHKADKANPHEVTKAQVGLGNVDNTADLDKPLSTAAQTALAAKANSTDVYTKAEVDELLEDIDVPTALSELADDSTHRLVTDAQKTEWSGKQDAISDLTAIRSGAALGTTAVQPETGKGLSTNDYTTAEKAKLDSLAEIKTIGTGLNLDDNGELTATGGGTGGTTNYNDLSNKPQINGNTLSGNKTGAQLGLASASDIPTTLAELTDDATHRVVSDTEKTAWNNKSDFSGSYNDLTDKPIIPDELSDLTEDATHRTVTDTEKATWNAKADVADIPTVPVKGVAKNGTALSPDASGVVNITVPTTAADVSALPNTTLYGASISLSINTTTFVVTATLKDQNGNTLGTAQTIDLPLESVVVNGSYNSATKKVVLTLQNGSTVEFSVADLVDGLQTELSATNKLNPAYINYDNTHRAVSDTEKSTWNGKQSALSTAQLAATNSGITNAELVELVDSGAKNFVNFSFGTVTEGGVTAVVNSDGSVTLNGTSTSSSAYIFQASNTPIKIKNNTSYVCKGTNNSGVRTQVIGFSEDETSYNLLCNSQTDITFDSENWHHYYVRILLLGNSTFSDVTIYPMCCLKTAWDISQAYVPYSPSNVEIAQTYIPETEKGVANGVALLGSDGHLTPAMMPTTIKTTSPATIESDTWTLLSDLTMAIPGGTVALCCVQTTFDGGQPTGVVLSVSNAADGATSVGQVLYKLEREDIGAINTCVMQNNRSNNPRTIYVWVKYGKSGTTGTINNPGRCNSSMTILSNYI